MELNDIPLRSYEDKGTVFTFYLTNTTMQQVMGLDGETLTITDNLKVIRQFQGLRAVSIENNNGVIAYRAARKLDPDTASVIKELQDNLETTRNQLAAAQAQVATMQEIQDATGDVIDLLIQQSAPTNEEVL